MRTHRTCTVVIVVFLSSCHTSVPPVLDIETRDSILSDGRKLILEDGSILSGYSREDARKIKETVGGSDPITYDSYFVTTGIVQCVFVWEMETRQRLVLSVLYSVPSKQTISINLEKRGYP